jgi:hypothetical protein
MVTTLNIPFQAIRQNAGAAVELYVASCFAFISINYLQLIDYFCGYVMIYRLYSKLAFDDEKRLFTTRPAHQHMWGYWDDQMAAAASLTKQGSGLYVGLQPNMSEPNPNSTGITFYSFLCSCPTMRVM